MIGPQYKGSNGVGAEIPVDDRGIWTNHFSHFGIIRSAGDQPLHEAVFVGFGGFEREDGIVLGEVEIDGEFVEVGEGAG